MKTLKFTCLLTMALNFVVTIYFCEQRTPDKQLFFMATNGFAFFLLVVSLVAGFCFCPREKLRAFVPALICIIGLPASMFMGGRLGSAIKDFRFQRNLPRYNAVVRLVEKGEIKSTPQSPLVNLPNEYADLAWRTVVKTNTDGIVIVFMTERGFPVKHSGYLFVSSGNIESDTNTLQSWPYHSRINTNWFYISD